MKIKYGKIDYSTLSALSKLSETSPLLLSPMVFVTCVMETQQYQSKQCSDVYKTLSRTERKSTEASVM